MSGKKGKVIWVVPTNSDDVREMSITERAWLAGIIDGEGSITYKRSGVGRYSPDRTIRIDLNVCNTCKELIFRIREITGVGAIVLEKDYRGQRRERWRWIVYRKKQIMQILEQILPFLVAKRERAQIALEICKFRVLNPSKPYEDYHFELAKKLIVKD